MRLCISLDEGSPEAFSPRRPEAESAHIRNVNIGALADPLCPREAVPHVACVDVKSRDLPVRIDAVGDAALRNACTGARRIQRCDSAVAVPQEAVVQVKAVVVVSCDRPRRVDRDAERPYTAGRIGRCIERGEAAVRVPPETAVIAPKRVSRNGLKVGSCDRTLRIDGQTWACTRVIDGKTWA